LLFMMAVLLLGCGRTTPAPVSAGTELFKLGVPAAGLYTGAYIEFGDHEDDVTLEKIEEFERMVGKHQAIVASSSYWGEQTFPEASVRLIARHGAVPLIYWSPWDRPYEEGRGPDKYSLTSIIKGDHDAYIDKWADQAKAMRTPIIVSFANEMNGSWFPWSGVLYGGGKSFTPPDKGTPEGPETFKQAHRHVVDRVRARGAANVQFVLHYMNYPDPNDKWNMMRFYYPGPDYCDWLGLSVYGSQFPGDPEWAPFPPLLDWPYQELCALDPTKPIMICEWGAADLPKLGDKAQWLRDGFRLLQDPAYGRIKAAVYWHERWENSLKQGDVDSEENAGKYSNLRVNSSPAVLEAYRHGVASPAFLGEPILQAVGK
jgi:beta-mannanase